MARAQAGKFTEALASYRALMKRLDQESQEEFASNFADSLAGAASSAGEFEVAKQVYEVLLARFGLNPNLKEKVKDDLARIERVGKPAPLVVVHDIDEKTFRLADLKGKYVL